MAHLKEINLVFGIKITCESYSNCLDQNAYILTVLKKFNIFHCKPLKCPLESNLDHTTLNSTNAVGCLMHLMICTEINLSVYVNILKEFKNKYNKELSK